MVVPLFLGAPAKPAIVHVFDTITALRG